MKNKELSKRALSGLAALSILYAVGCSGTAKVAGGGTEDVNARTVVGRIVSPDGFPAGQADVFLIPQGYDPVAPDSGSRSIERDTTDSKGRYVLHAPDTGIYNIQAVDEATGSRLFVQSIHVTGPSDTLSNDTLHPAGAVRVILPDTLDFANGYLFIPGTNVFVLLNGKAAVAVIDSVPSGKIPSILYAVRNSTAAPALVCDTIGLEPGDTITLAYFGWKFSRRLVLNTTASGAGISGNVTNFPVLVRLTQGNFAFSGAAAGGNDIRFAKADGTPLAFQIERWDAGLMQAEIWVGVDTVFGNNGSQFITMHWGNAGASGTSDGSAVFDTLNGFQAVWHLQEPSGAIALDATANRFNGTPSNSAPVATMGMIGTGKHFDGASQSFDMIGTGSSKLTFSEKGHYSVSAWVYTDTLTDSTAHLIIGKGHRNYYLKLFYDLTNGQQWEFTEFHDRSGWEIANYLPAVAKTWKCLVGVRDGTSQYLYVDGQLVFTTNGYSVDDTLPRDTTSDVSIGRYLQFVAQYNQGYGFFNGAIDEVRIQSIAPGADWIRLCYMNQKETDALVEMK